MSGCTPWPRPSRNSNRLEISSLYPPSLIAGGRHVEANLGNAGPSADHPYEGPLSETSSTDLGPCIPVPETRSLDSFRRDLSEQGRQGTEICSGASTAPLILRALFSLPVFFPNRLEPSPDLPRRPHRFCSTSSLPSPARRWPPGTFSFPHKPSRDHDAHRYGPVPARIPSEMQEFPDHTGVPNRSDSQGRSR